MTVASETNRSGPYSGNGVTTVFAYGFRIVDQSHLQVIRANATGDETTLALLTDYTVSGVGSAGGGSITLTTALPSGSTVTILRSIPFTQETDLENQGAYYAQTVEDALDLAVMRDQQLAEKLNRAVLVPATETDPAGALASQLAADITRLADSADNIDTVADNIADVNAVADNVADLNTVADNIGAIVAAAGSVLDLVDASFAGNGSNDVFTLPAPATADQNVLVWVGGVRQVPGDDYSVSGTMLTLTAIPGAGVAIDVLVITAVTAQAIFDLYGELQKAVNIGRCTVLANAGQTTYAVSTDGDPLGLTPSNHILIGPAPFGALTYGVDYTVTEAGALVLAFSPREGDLLHLFLTPRTTNEEAQQILNEFQAMVAGDADRSEAAADAAAGSATAAATSATAAAGSATAAATSAAVLTQLQFASRGAFQAATIDTGVNSWTIKHAGMSLRYVRTSTAWRAAITSANGVHGIPADTCTAEHYGAARDGVTDDAPAINAACNAFGHCHLTYGSYAVGSTLDLETQSIFGSGPQATTILGLSASLSATAPIVAVGKSGSLRGVWVKYDAITGSETRGQRIAVQPYSLAASAGVNRAADITSVLIGKCGTGLGDAGNTFFSTSFHDIWITEFSHRGVDFYSQNRTGNSYDNIYVGSPANANTPLNCLSMEGDEHSSFFGQINLEHTACTGSVARFYGQVGHSINSIHIEGTDLLTANTAIIEVDSSLIQLHALNVLHTRQTADNVSLFWLRDPRSAEAQEGASFTATRQRGRLFVGNLELRGLADPNTGLYPSYPSGRRGLANVAGWKFVRSADTTRGWDVEVGNVSTHIYTAAANDEPIYRYASNRYSDAANFSLLRWGRKGPLGAPNLNFLSNGDFTAWTATSATASGSAVQGPTGWFAHTGTGSLSISRQTEGDGMAHREFLRASNIGTSGNYQSVYQDIPLPRRLMGEKITLSFDARASVAGRRLEQVHIEILNSGGSPSSFYSQIIGGGNAQIQLTTEWQRFEITDDAILTSAITAWGSNPVIRLHFQINDAAGTRESQIDIDRIKLEVGAVATHMEA